MSQGLPPETSLEDVKLRITQSYRNPNVGKTTQAVLKDGPVAFKIATLMEVINPESKAFHHYSLKIDHIDRRKAGWFHKPEKSVRLDGKTPDEIEKLYKFLHAVYEKSLGEATGKMHLITSAEYAKLENILAALPRIADSDKLSLVSTILGEIDESNASLSMFVQAFEHGKEETLRHIATASRLVDYSKALSKLRALVSDPSTSEKVFQAHLEANPWMFGSEYSELLSRRTWTRDDRLDYMLRRTVDGFLEIVEIKTAFAEPLLLYDASHDSHYPSSRLSPVLGQVARYIEEVERDRNSIIAKDSVDTLKIRARVILGRDGTDKHQAALRSFNSHLHRIEVITYDQLIRIAERVLGVFEEKPQSIAEQDFDDDIPF